jgi:hypothetical protein
VEVSASGKAALQIRDTTRLLIPAAGVGGVPFAVGA